MSANPNIAEYVLTGHYYGDGSLITPTNIYYFTDWVFENIVLPRGNVDMYQTWVYENYTHPFDDMKLNLLYFAVCKLIDNLDFSAFSKRQHNSIYLFARDLLTYIALQEKRDPVEDGGTRYWFRLGNVLCELGDHQSALEVYNEGISILKRIANWRLGDLIGREKMFGMKFSMIEWLYAARGRCEWKMGLRDNAEQSILTVLKSIKIRGHHDLIDMHFPYGIRIYLS